VPAADVTAPLPSLAQSAAPADLLASRLSESAREALAFAVALDGECPHASHLPALVGDTHGDAALGELTSVGLAVPVASHFRLAAGVVQQLSVTLAADGELSDVQAHSAALHYSWWTGHPSVAPERVAAESEAIVAAMAGARSGGHASATVLLARTVAPVFAAALHWGAWERTLRIGQEAARQCGEVAEEAYFHHELGVIALCSGNLDRARAELEASIALRAALADRQGTVVGRRTLALVNDIAGDLPPAPGPLALAAPEETTLALPGPVPALAVISRQHPAPAPAHHAAGPGPGRLAVLASRRNLVAAGTGVLLAGALGTIVTLGAASHGSSDTPNQVKPIESVQQAPPDDTTSASQKAPAAPAAAPSTSASKRAAAIPPTANPSTTVTYGGLSTAPGTPTPSRTTSSTTGGTTTGGGHPTTGGTTGATTSGTTGGTKPTTGGNVSGGSTTSGSTTAGSTTSGSTTAGGTTSGSTTSGSTTAGSTTSGSTTSGSTTAGSTTTGSTTSGSTTSGSSTTGTTSGSSSGSSGGTTP
jgi:hypothetical protein